MALLYRKWLIALTGAFVLAFAVTGAALAAKPGPAVKVEIKTGQKTLRTAVVSVKQGWITRFGAPNGKCPARSAAGALNVATHGHWAGKYYAKFSDYLVTSILGRKPAGKSYWELIVNGKAASTGVCHVKLRPHETIVFKIAK